MIVGAFVWATSRQDEWICVYSRLHLLPGSERGGGGTRLCGPGIETESVFDNHHPAPLADYRILSILALAPNYSNLALHKIREWQGQWIDPQNCGTIKIFSLSSPPLSFSLCFTHLQAVEDWSYDISCVRSLSRNKRDSRGLFLYVIDKYCEDFQIFFSSEDLCKK